MLQKTHIISIKFSIVGIPFGASNSQYMASA